MKRKNYKIGEIFFGRTLQKISIEGNPKRQILHLYCPDCQKVSKVRQDNLNRQPECVCKARQQFKTWHKNFVPDKEYYTEQDINDLARKFKVGKTNVAFILDTKKIPHDQITDLKSELTESDKKKIQVCQSFGLSRDETVAKVQTNANKISNDKFVGKFEKKTNSTLLDEWEKLRLSGWTLDEIALSFDCSRQQVSYQLRQRFGTSFAEEAKRKKKYRKESDSNAFLMKSDHRLSQSVLKKDHQK